MPATHEDTPITGATAAEYVDQHMPMLTAYSYGTRFRPRQVEPDDFRSDLVASVLTAYHGFRKLNDDGAKKPCEHCGRIGCSTWLGWRARRVAADHLRTMAREQERVDAHADVEVVATMPAHLGSPGRIAAQAQVQLLLDRATPEQREALIARLEEWNGDEVWARLGISMGGLRYRIKQLQKQLNP